MFWRIPQCFSDSPCNFPSLPTWRFSGHSRIGFVMLLFCCLIQSPETPTKEPRVMNKEALPLFPWSLFLGCYTECLLLTKPVMDVRLPLSLCLGDKEGLSLYWHSHRGKHANTHLCTPQTYTHHHPQNPAYNHLQISVLNSAPFF